MSPFDCEITINDATTWTRPWTAVIRLRQTEDSIYEFACHEGNHHVIRGISRALAPKREPARADNPYACP
jgi:hypothetical protein